MAHKPTPKLKRLTVVDYAGFLVRMAAEPCIRFPGKRGCLNYPQPCWQRMAVNPLTVVAYHGYYSTTNSVIYVSAAKLGAKARLAMRLRDDQGRCWLAQPEPQGPVDGIYPFLVDLPPEVNRVTPELVVLKPVEAEFTAKIPAPPIP
jgi:hypothetical protein